MPNVIYDRGVNFSLKQKKSVKNIRKKFQNHPSIYFINNQDYLGKWQLYKKMAQYPEMRKYLPETRRYCSFIDLESMLKKYNYIFLKSFYGSHGKEVLSIEKNDNQFRLNFFKKELKTVLVENIQSLKEYVEDFIGVKPFIIQEGIRLLKFKGSNMDIRVLIEKNYKNQWKAIYNQARIAQKKFTITNRYVGASIENYQKIYSYLNFRSYKYLPTDQQIRKVTITLAEYIEKAFGSFGEIGMDMAI